MLNASSLRERLVAVRIATAASICGCSDAEVRNIESTLKLRLPRAYSALLRVVGKRAGAFMRDIDFHYPKVLDLRQAAIELLDNWEEGRLQLPSDAFVFAMRYGEQFMFFRTDNFDEDPAIWFYMESHDTFQRIAESIWEVIESELQLSESFRRNYPNSPLIPEPE